MQNLQELLDKTLKKIPQLILEKRLAEKLNVMGLETTKASLRKVTEHILSGNTKNIKIDGIDDDVTIEITDEDIEYVTRGAELFYSEHLEDTVLKAAEETSNRLYKFLKKGWTNEFHAQQTDVRKFKDQLEHRWGKALGKLRLLLTIVREWCQSAHERRLHTDDAKVTHLEDVILRLHVRACQVATEIIALLENGLADGAMARWRTLHEITIVAAVIVKFGEEIAERYMYYQIVESFGAIKAYERDHKGLGYKPPTKRQSQKIRKDYNKITKRYGKKFGEEYGWAAHHLKIKEKERLTFAKLEDEAGDAFMRSPYKMASYNVHASPKGIYFKLGYINDSKSYLAGMSNAGLTDPAQHTAISLTEITMLIIGDSATFYDLVTANIITRLESEIPQEFWKADKKLRRDDRRYRKNVSGNQSG